MKKPLKKSLKKPLKKTSKKTSAKPLNEQGRPDEPQVLDYFEKIAPGLRK